MSPDDFIYGSRSGIQKAIRRGDLDLAHTCFNALWAEKEHRNWLKWRVYTLTIEEAWQLSGELAKLIESKSVEKKDWQKFIYQLTIATKSKDTVGLWGLTHEAANGAGAFTPLHPEIGELSVWRANYRGKIAKAEDDPDFLGLHEHIFHAYAESDGVSEYEMSALRMMQKRAKLGGMIGDRQFCVAAMVLLYSRGLNEDEVKADLEKSVERWKQETKRTKPKTVNLPWYAFDRHTQLGKIAFSTFVRRNLKKYDIDEDELWAMWFYIESAKSPKSLVRLPQITSENASKIKLTALDSAWWIPYLKYRLSFKNLTIKEVIKLWKEDIREDMKSLIGWLIEKRSG